MTASSLCLVFEGSNDTCRRCRRFVDNVDIDKDEMSLMSTEIGEGYSKGKEAMSNANLPIYGFFEELYAIDHPSSIIIN